METIKLCVRLTVFDRLYNHFDKARFVFLEILPTAGCLPESVELARDLTNYIETCTVHKSVWLLDFIDEIHIKNDDVHFTNIGYHLFTEQVFSIVMNSFLMPVMRQEKQTWTKEAKEV